MIIDPKESVLKFYPQAKIIRGYSPLKEANRLGYPITYYVMFERNFVSEASFLKIDFIMKRLRGNMHGKILNK